MMKVSWATFESKAHIYSRPQPESIQHVTERIEMGHYDLCAQDEKDVCDLMKDVQLINSTIEGSAAARSKMRNEIHAMITSHGTPSFFILLMFLIQL